MCNVPLPTNAIGASAQQRLFIRHAAAINAELERRGPAVEYKD